MEICQKIAQKYYFFLVVFGVSKLDYLLNVQGSIFAWRVHHMSDKSHALEVEFTEMKSRVTASFFLFCGSKYQRVMHQCEGESLLAESLSNMKNGKMEITQDLKSRVHFIIVLQILSSLVILYWEVIIECSHSEKGSWSWFWLQFFYLLTVWTGVIINLSKPQPIKWITYSVHRVLGKMKWNDIY